MDPCRLCLKCDNELLYIFHTEDRRVPLAEKINICLAIQVTVEDKISLKICRACREKIDSFYDFRISSKESQKTLEDWLISSELSATLQDAEQVSPILANNKREGKMSEAEEAASQEKSSPSGTSSSSSSTSEGSSSSDEESRSESEDSDGDSLTRVGTHQVDDEVITLHPAEPPLYPASAASSQVQIYKKRKNTDSKRTSQAVIKCLVCEKLFASRCELRKHLEAEEPTGHRVCAECGRVCASGSQLVRHLRAHRRRYNCPECSYTTVSATNLTVHRLKHDKQYVGECGECGRRFYTSWELREHLTSRHPPTRVVGAGGGAAAGSLPVQQTYCCPTVGCGKSFTSLRYLRRHQLAVHRHTPASSFQCELCGQLFLTAKGVNRHRLSRHLGHRYKCDVCNKEVTCLQSLKHHKKTHTGEKGFVCDICGKGFIKIGNLKSHERVHTGEKPYECTNCGRRFAQRTTLQIHSRSHSGERPYECDLCGKGFTTRSQMGRHRRVHSKEPPPLPPDVAKTPR